MQQVGGAAVLDPSTLALSSWVRASYGGAPWVGTASAGTSAAKSWTTPPPPPTVGTAVNGFTPALYNGTTQYLRDIVDLATDYISQTAYRVVLLIEPGSLSAPTAQPYDNAGLLVETGGNWGVFINSSVVGVYHYDGAYKVASASVVAGKMAVDVTFTGTTLTTTVNGTAGTPVAAGTLGAISTDLRLGANYSAAKKYPGTIIEAMSATTALASTSAAAFVGYFNQRYALSL